MKQLRVLPLLPPGWDASSSQVTPKHSVRCDASTIHHYPFIHLYRKVLTEKGECLASDTTKRKSLTTQWLRPGLNSDDSDRSGTRTIRPGWQNLTLYERELHHTSLSLDTLLRWNEVLRKSFERVITFQYTMLKSLYLSLSVSQSYSARSKKNCNPWLVFLKSA